MDTFSNIESVLGTAGSDNFEGTSGTTLSISSTTGADDQAIDESTTDSDTLDFSAVTKPMTFNFTPRRNVNAER